jgi:glycosyltransferase involved in cell wall biosynthesis
LLALNSRHLRVPDKLKIAHVTATFPPYLGGTGNVAYHNALELARLGHEVHVLVPGERSVPEQCDGVTVHWLHTLFRIGNAPYAARLGRVLAGFDLVHLHYPFYFGAEQTARACLRSGTPYVVTYHNDVLFPSLLSLAVEAHHRLIGDRILRRAAAVIVSTLDFVPDSRLNTLPPARLFEIPNGVDTTRFDRWADAGEVRRRSGLDPGRPTLLFVAALDRAHYFKGLDVLLTALGFLPDAQLLVLGDGDLRQLYERRAAAMRLGGRVRFVGRKSTDLPAYFNVADVLVVPSITRAETFSLVAAEAMSCGVPVVASRFPGIRTVVQDGQTGLLVEPGNAADLAAKLRQILADGELRSRLAANGYRRARERYDWRTIGPQLEALYYSVLGVTRP